jgi:hypothetical protein
MRQRSFTVIAQCPRRSPLSWCRPTLFKGLRSASDLATFKASNRSTASRLHALTFLHAQRAPDLPDGIAVTMLRGLARSERFVEWDQSDATRPVPPCKNIPVPFRPKSPLHARRPIPPRGVSRSSRTRGGTRWTQAALLTRAWFCGRRSRVVLTPRRWRQVGGRNFTGDGGKQARSPRRARSKPLNPLRGECRVIRCDRGD